MSSSSHARSAREAAGLPLLGCDVCSEQVPDERLSRYDANPNHDCERDGHFCSVGCYDYATGQVR